MGNSQQSRRHFLANAVALGSLWLHGSYPPGKHDMMGIGTHTINFTDPQETWIDLEGEIYGAKADAIGPIGGGPGYERMISRGDVTVEDLDTLIAALDRAKSGDVIFIPGHITIDFTTYVYIDSFVLGIPGGVTLASDRGTNGSKGALLTSEALKTDKLIQTLGSQVRLTGLRIQGPNGKRYMAHHAKSFGPGGARHSYYYKFPISDGITTDFGGLEVDNCELTSFSRAAISLRKGSGHHVHHCFIHHCQYNGLGYGVANDASTATIEYNLFDYNRHSIAGTGIAGSGYIARHNVELGVSLSHCFDMHGGRDRKDGTEIAGTALEIYNNTFRAPQLAIGIRGIPEEFCDIHHNWFTQFEEQEEAIRGLDYVNVHAYANAYGKSPSRPR